MRQSLYDYCMQNNRIDLLQQWDTDANLPLTPKTVTSGSSRKVWWFCGKGHHWQQEPRVRTAHQAECPVCRGKQIIPSINDLKTLAPDIANEWNDEKNGVLRPEELSPFSHRKVWWKCDACGHEWAAQIKSRAGSGSCGCPVCANRVVIPGVNDLATTHPELAKEWHPTKNGSLTPQSVPPGTMRKAWWRCEQGHEWQAAISSRTRGAGCPFCRGKAVLPGFNDLASFFPKIAREWHPTKNGKLTPDMVTEQSNRSVWWSCSLGHEYKALVSSRVTRGSGCPYCANRRVLPGFNDLASRLPDVAKEWHPTLNGALTPGDVTCGSRRSAWWQCGEGHVWKAVICSRAGAQQCGCPACAGKVNMARRKYYDRIIAEAKALEILGDTRAADKPAACKSGPGPPEPP